MLALMFPGQGSQKRGMGQGLLDEVKEFATVEREINEILGYSLRSICLEDPDNRLSQTQYTQPSLYIVNALHYYKSTAEGLRPNFILGHSIGEYNALHAAGAFDLLAGLRLVQKRGELMATATGGGMAAIIGLTSPQISQVLEENGLRSLDLANYNSPAQIVVSGPAEDIKRAGPLLEKAGAQLYIPLRVSAAFHSRYMADAAKEFAAFLGSFSFTQLKTPVISNVTGRAYPHGDPNEVIRSLLARQIIQPVLWTQSIQWLIEQGTTSFTEVGPGTVLTKLVQQIQKH